MVEKTTPPPGQIPDVKTKSKSASFLSDAEFHEDAIGPVTNASELDHALRTPTDWTPSRLGELLCHQGVISRDQLNRALKEQEENGGRLGEVLERLGIITQETVSLALARKFGIPFVHLSGFDNDPEALLRLPESLARSCRAFPLAFHKKSLVVAVEDPTDSNVLNMLRFASGINLEVCVATRKEIEFAINKHYGATEAEQAVQEVDAWDEPALTDEMGMDAEALAQQKPVVRLVEGIFADAIEQRASDIHVRPGEKNVEILFRIDGVLREQRTLSKKLLPALVSRLKIVGDMNISEKRLPQDGRARIAKGNKTVDLRFSVMPTVKGESLVMRLINPQNAVTHLDDLGFGDKDTEAMRDFLHRSQGMVLVTGPTGSGKSTTLYSALEEIRKRKINIITVEDPVEYPMEEVEQIQVNAAIGYTFPRALRQILRHDPDAIMVGEIRDRETAKVAVESALTGHLLLSTLHTNGAADTVARLLEMGIEPYLLNSTLLAVLAQRLVRKNCPHCLVEDPALPHHRKSLNVADSEVFYKGKGCSRCDNTGYRGRFAVHELLVMSSALRNLIEPGIAADDIQRIAVEEGMTTLTANALEAARRRETTLEEVFRVRLE